MVRAIERLHIFKDMQAKVGCEYISDLPFTSVKYGVNSVLYNIVDTYNKTEVENA